MEYNGFLVSISSTFYAHFFYQYFGAKKFQTQNKALEIFSAKNIGPKCARKMSMKLTSNFEQHVVNNVER